MMIISNEALRARVKKLKYEKNVSYKQIAR